jgi:PucR family transcriptional regulator, purine catabolism regulatory protein
MRNGHDQEITVAAALRLGPLSEGVPEVLAGAGSLKNSIRWVHSGEWLEMASVLRGGELLLTTGMGFPDSPSAQRKFVASLAERSIAGLVIELHTSIDQVPRPVVEEAEARHLPLIVLHREVPFVEVTESLHREIVGQQALALEHAERAHRRFTELILDGAGVPEVLEELADLIGNPVLLQKADEGVLYHHPHATTDAAVLAAWDTVTHRLPEAPEHVSVAVEVGHGRTWGTLTALALSSPLRRHHRIVLERGASVIALSMLRRNAEPSLAARRRGQFIASLMHPGAAIDEREATEMAAELGFDRRALLRLPIVAIGTSRWLEAEADEEAPWPTLWREVTRELESMRVSAIAGVLPEGGLAIVVALRGESDRAEMAGRISRRLRSAAESRLSGQELIVCAGSVARSWTETGGQLHDALDMSHAVVRAPRQEWLDTTAVRLEPLLWALRNDEALRSFVRRRLDPLVAHDREHRTQFMATVEAYCVHSGRIAETARDLHLQRQSLYKRIERIQELLGCDLVDPDTRLGLHFALRARSYLAALEATGDR